MHLSEEVIDQCLRIGIREFVVCPGGRNVPLIAVLDDADGVQIWTHHDERVAGFFALGRSMGSGEPCAVVVTSGTAVAELLPAVIEAKYQGRPIVIISADRPSSYRGSGAPQVINQVGIFGEHVERCVDIERKTDSGFHCEDVFSGWSKTAPWHLNVCLGEKEEILGKKLSEPNGFVLDRKNFHVGELVKHISDVWNGLCVFVGGLDPEDREEVYYFLKDLKVPVIADATSGLREGLHKIKLLVSKPDHFFKNNQFGRVLRIGEVPVGRAWRELENHAQIEVFNVCRTPYTGISRDSNIVTGNITRILKGMGEIFPVGDTTDALVHNSKGWAQVDEMLERFPESEPAMVRLVSQYAVSASSLFLGNSMPIREWNEFAQREHPQENVDANRGVNGIDGQLSTWIGNTVGFDDSWAIFGDLTTQYDQSALSLLAQCGAKRRVLIVINNAGGRIFDRLPAVQVLDDHKREIIQNETPFDYKAWADMWGMDYQLARCSDEIDIDAPDHGLIVELRPSDKETEAFWEIYSGA